MIFRDYQGQKVSVSEFKKKFRVQLFCFNLVPLEIFEFFRAGPNETWFFLVRRPTYSSFFPYHVRHTPRHGYRPPRPLPREVRKELKFR